MTALARQHVVTAGQGESGGGMIEQAARPAVGAMALLAVTSKAAVVDVVLLMAGRAVALGNIKAVFQVAGGTLQLYVFAR